MKIDWWTLGLQTINVLVLLWILQRFFFKPVMAVIARRQDEVRRLTEAAEQTNLLAEQERKALEQDRNAAAAVREQLLEQAHAEAQGAAQALLAQAREDAAACSAAQQVALDRERTECLLELQQRAGELAVDIAARLLRRIPADQLDVWFIEAACAAFPRPLDNAQPVESDHARRIPVRVVSAAPLCAAAQEAAAGLLAAATGQASDIAYSVDPALIAGVELHVGQAVITNNLAADLRAIMEQLHRAPDPA